DERFSDTSLLVAAVGAAARCPGVVTGGAAARWHKLSGLLKTAGGRPQESVSTKDQSAREPCEVCALPIFLPRYPVFLFVLIPGSLAAFVVSGPRVCYFPYAFVIP